MLLIPRRNSLINLTEEMCALIDHSIEDGNPCILATSSCTGELTIGYRGSMITWDSNSLAYWERGTGKSLSHIENGNSLAVIFRNPKLKKGWKFFGTGTLYRDGPIRDAVMHKIPQPEIDRDPNRTGIAVIIRLDRVEDLIGTLLMSDK